MSTTEESRASSAQGRRWTAVAALCAAPLLLGVYADVGQYADGFWGKLPELGTPWLLVAFAGGRVVERRPLVAAGTGLALILGGLAVYGLFVHLVHGTELYNVVMGGRASYWAVTAAVLGPVAGLAGAWSRLRRPLLRSIGWGFAVAVPLAELGRIVLLAQGYLHDPGLAISLVLLASAVALAALKEVWSPGLVTAAVAWAGVGYAASRLIH